MYTGQKGHSAQEQRHRTSKVQWTYYNIEEATWELEDAMWKEYPHWV